MAGDASKFIHISPKNSKHVIYEDNNKGKILGVGKIGTNPSTSTKNIDGLKHSLLSIYQLCDKGLLVSFDSHIFQQAVTFSFGPRNGTLNCMACYSFNSL